MILDANFYENKRIKGNKIRVISSAVQRSITFRTAKCLQYKKVGICIHKRTSAKPLVTKHAATEWSLRHGKESQKIQVTQWQQNFVQLWSHNRQSPCGNPLFSIAARQHCVLL